MRRLLDTLTILICLALLGLGPVASQTALASGDVGILPVTAVHASPGTDPSRPALNLVDADLGSIWQSAPEADSMWAVLEFGAPYRVDFARVYAPGQTYGEIAIQYQEEGVWRPLSGGAHVSLPATGGWQDVDLSFDGVVADRLRIYVRRTGLELFLGGIGQVEIHGSSPVTGPSRLTPVEVTATTESNPGLPAKNLVDGNTYTRWETGPTRPQSVSVVFRLPEPAKLSALKLYGSGEAADVLTWEYWGNGAWIPFADLRNVPVDTLQRGWHRFDVAQADVTTDRVRLTVDNRRGLDELGGFGEVEIWGIPVSVSTVSSRMFARRTVWSPSGRQTLDSVNPETSLLFTLPDDLANVARSALIFDGQDVDGATEFSLVVNGVPVNATPLGRFTSDAWGMQALPLDLSGLKPGLNEISVIPAAGADGLQLDNARIELLSRDGVVFPVRGAEASAQDAELSVQRGAATDRQALTAWETVAGPDGVGSLEVALPSVYQLEEIALFQQSRIAQVVDVEYRDGERWIPVPGLTGVDGQSLARNWNLLVPAGQPAGDRLL